MTSTEANMIITDFYTSDMHSDADKFMFVEAMHLLIEEYQDPIDIYNLAWHYAEERRFDLYRKYLEQAAGMDYGQAYEGLGYVWYYGQTGKVDYKKAYDYFSKGAGCGDDMVKINCTLKLADMYRYGYYVDKDENRFRELMYEIYDMTQHPEQIHSVLPASELLPDPYINIRIAEICMKDGGNDRAYRLLMEAKMILSDSIVSNPFWWGNIEEMENVVRLIHELDPEPAGLLDIYDIFWIGKRPSRIRFLYGDRQFVIECEEVDGSIAVRFDNKWYRDVRSFLEKAEIDGRKVIAEYYELREVDYEWISKEE
ncbi:MAG: sel1 repeat family protein [Clostridiales bacterium]|nr:sel1 repeat family protein [Clostridiales bacterium]